MEFDYIVVGAGYAGAVIAERLANKHNKKVLVIEQRDHIAGNAYDYYDEAGVLCHKYGPHIFHTNNKEVAKYLSQFTEWHPYEHRVLGMVNKRLIPIPFNLTSLNICFDVARASLLKEKLLAEYGEGKKVSISKLRESSDQDVKELAEFIFENIFLHYTTKQWGLKPEELDPSILSRVPIYTDYDDRYFKDDFQNMPKEGYTKMFENILCSANIEVQLGVDFLAEIENYKDKKIIYTGPVDRLCDYEYGVLPYRSLRFDVQTYEQKMHQPVGQVNYPDKTPFTRISEYKHMTGQQLPKTTVAIEYPQEYIEGENDPYYPIITDDNRAKYKQYLSLVKEKYPNVYLAGRLADYVYYNMDQVVARALTQAEKIVAQ